VIDGFFSDCHFAFIPAKFLSGRQCADRSLSDVLSTSRLLLVATPALDLELDDLALELIDLLGQGIDLDAESRRCLIYQVDCLVRQKRSVM
jgi:hypothetical protein